MNKYNRTSNLENLPIIYEQENNGDLDKHIKRKENSIEKYHRMFVQKLEDDEIFESDIVRTYAAERYSNNNLEKLKRKKKVKDFTLVTSPFQIYLRERYIAEFDSNNTDAPFMNDTRQDNNPTLSILRKILLRLCFCYQYSQHT